MAIIKLFLPKCVYYSTFLCDQILYGEIVSDANSGNISIYILNAETDQQRKALSPIGLIKGFNPSDLPTKSYFVVFTQNDASNHNSNTSIILNQLNPPTPTYPGNEGASEYRTQIMLYDLEGFIALSKSTENELAIESNESVTDGNNSITYLTGLLRTNEELRKATKKTKSWVAFDWIILLFCKLYAIVIRLIPQRIQNVVFETAISRHFSIWSQCIQCYSFKK